MNNILTLETNRYAIKLDNFEGPLDLLCHLVDKNKMDIHAVNISKITDQYVEYINAMQELNLDIASEFVLMASTLLYIKSRGLLPNAVDDEEELTEEELIRRIIEYKKYKEISKALKELYVIYSKRIFKLPEKIQLPTQKLEESYEPLIIYDAYRVILEKNKLKVNKKAIDIEQIALMETVTVASKVKDIFRELLKKPSFVFNKLCASKKYTRMETVTAFTGLLELSRRKKIIAMQKQLFGDIVIEKRLRERV